MARASANTAMMTMLAMKVLFNMADLLSQVRCVILRSLASTYAVSAA
jgi:hypothetical protein